MGEVRIGKKEEGGEAEGKKREMRGGEMKGEGEEGGNGDRQTDVLNSFVQQFPEFSG